MRQTLFPCADIQTVQPHVRLHVRMFLLLASLPLLLFLMVAGLLLLRGMDSILTSTADIRNTYLPAVFTGHRTALDVESLRRHALTVYLGTEPETRRSARLAARAMSAGASFRASPALHNAFEETCDLLQAIEARRFMSDAALRAVPPPLLEIENLLNSAGPIPPDIIAMPEWQEVQPAALLNRLHMLTTPQELRVLLARMQTYLDRLMLTPVGSTLPGGLLRTMSRLLEQSFIARIRVLDSDTQAQQLWKDTEQRLGALRDQLNVASVELTYDTLTSIDTQANSIERLLYLSVGLVFITFLIMISLLHVYIVRPIIRTSHKLQDIRTGQQSAPLESIHIAELNEVSTLINMFSEQLSVMYQHARNLEREKDHIESLAITDALTGIYNRRYFDIQYKLLCDEAVIRLKPLSVVMLDIDLFKVYNDTLGHPAGDECLVLVARAVRGSLLRTSDRAFRYGGEEFVVLLPDCPADAAKGLAERIRARVQELGIIHPGSPVSPVVTVSVGVGTCVPEAPVVGKPLLDLADIAMYRSKTEGRNRVTLATSDAEPPAVSDTPSPAKEAPCTD